MNFLRSLLFNEHRNLGVNQISILELRRYQPLERRRRSASHIYETDERIIDLTIATDLKTPVQRRLSENPYLDNVSGTQLFHERVIRNTSLDRNWDLPPG